MSSSQPKNLIALVTGANRGIGFEVARQLGKQGIRVCVTARSDDKAKQAVAKLASEGIEAIAFACDVSSEKSIRELAVNVEKQLGRLDILVNNAGIFPDAKASGLSVFNSNLELVREAMDTNTYGPMLMMQAFIPLMKENNYGRVVNISSGMGQLSEMSGSYAAYRMSKVSLNALTRIFANEVSGSNILINSVCPGWVKTDMGGANAERPVEKGAETPVWLATLADGGPSGGFFRDKETIAW